MKQEVVIIGSGLGSLICGVLLSRAGKQVTVLERQHQPGGCMQSYQRDGLPLDTGLHYVGGLAAGQRLHRIFNHLGLMQLPWYQLDTPCADQVTIGEQHFAFPQGYEAFYQEMASHFPQEQAGLRQYVSLLQEIEHITDGSERMQELLGTNAYDYLCQTFSDPLLINVLAGTSLKMELKRDTLPLFHFLHSNSSYIGSSWRLRGGGHLLVKHLVDEIEAQGGKVICGKEVKELKVGNGQITAAICKDGETFEAQTIISDAHPAVTIGLIQEKGALRNIYRQRILRQDNTFGMFTASLVLKPDALPYFNHNKFVYRQPSVWTFHEDKAQSIGGLLISAQVPQEGEAFTRQIDLLTPMSWEQCQPWADTTTGRRGESYKAMKERWADACIQLAEQVIPGLGQMVEKRYTSTPLTYRDYNLSPQGSAYGMRKDCHSAMTTMMPVKTPIPNLLLTGQSLALHGVEGVTMTALNTCKELIGNEIIENIDN